MKDFASAVVALQAVTATRPPILLSTEMFANVLTDSKKEMALALKLTRVRLHFFYKYSYTYVFIYSCMFDKIARKYVKVLIAVFNYEETTEPYTSTTLPFSTSPDYESSNQINLSQEPLMSPIKLRYFIIFDTYFQFRKIFL